MEKSDDVCGADFLRTYHRDSLYTNRVCTKHYTTCLKLPGPGGRHWKAARFRPVADPRPRPTRGEANVSKPTRASQLQAISSIGLVPKRQWLMHKRRGSKFHGKPWPWPAVALAKPGRKARPEKPGGKARRRLVGYISRSGPAALQATFTSRPHLELRQTDGRSLAKTVEHSKRVSDSTL